MNTDTKASRQQANLLRVASIGHVSSSSLFMLNDFFLFTPVSSHTAFFMSHDIERSFTSSNRPPHIKVTQNKEKYALDYYSYMINYFISSSLVL